VVKDDKAFFLLGEAGTKFCGYQHVNGCSVLESNHWGGHLDEVGKTRVALGLDSKICRNLLAESSCYRSFFNVVKPLGQALVGMGHMDQDELLWPRMGRNRPNGAGRVNCMTLVG
jgi:hypothetical protein